jgi:Gly-Xaa carboxypeptidase
MAHDGALLKGLAAEFNLSYTAFGEAMSEDGAPAIGTLTLKDAYGTSLEPAPVSPISGKGSAPYQLLSGTIKATYAAHRGLSATDASSAIAVAPAMSTGNTGACSQ